MTKQVELIPKIYAERSWENTQDFKNALEFAEKSLDEPYTDPDDDIRTLSRQFIRMIERYDSLLIFTRQAQQEDVEKFDFEWNVKSINKVIKNYLLPRMNNAVGKISDGYHTFNELYEFRKLYNAALFNEWANQGKYNVHKSTRHHDGKACFGGGWFIVMATLPTGQISNHYEAKDWKLFKCDVRERADKWDGHTSQDVLKRLEALQKEQE